MLPSCPERPSLQSFADLAVAHSPRDVQTAEQIRGMHGWLDFSSDCTKCISLFMLIQGFTYMLIFRLFMLITWLYTAAASGNVRSSLLFTLIQLPAGKISHFLQKSSQCSADSTSSYLDCTLRATTQLMILIHCN